MKKRLRKKAQNSMCSYSYYSYLIENECSGTEEYCRFTGKLCRSYVCKRFKVPPKDITESQIIREAFKALERRREV